MQLFLRDRPRQVCPVLLDQRDPLDLRGLLVQLEQTVATALRAPPAAMVSLAQQGAMVPLDRLGVMVCPGLLVATVNLAPRALLALQVLLPSKDRHRIYFFSSAALIVIPCSWSAAEILSGGLPLNLSTVDIMSFISSSDLLCVVDLWDTEAIEILSAPSEVC